MVVCAGSSILDLGLTLNFHLETKGVPVLGYGTG